MVALCSERRLAAASPAILGGVALNRANRVRDAQGGAAYFGYDAVGNLARTTDPLGRNTYFAYDALDRLRAVVEGATAGLPG